MAGTRAPARLDPGLCRGQLGEDPADGLFARPGVAQPGGRPAAPRGSRRWSRSITPGRRARTWAERGCQGGSLQAGGWLAARGTQQGWSGSPWRPNAFAVSLLPRAPPRGGGRPPAQGSAGGPGPAAARQAAGGAAALAAERHYGQTPPSPGNPDLPAGAAAAAAEPGQKTVLTHAGTFAILSCVGRPRSSGGQNEVSGDRTAFCGCVTGESPGAHQHMLGKPPAAASAAANAPALRPAIAESMACRGPGGPGPWLPACDRCTRWTRSCGMPRYLAVPFAVRQPGPPERLRIKCDTSSMLPGLDRFVTRSQYFWILLIYAAAMAMVLGVLIGFRAFRPHEQRVVPVVGGFLLRPFRGFRAGLSPGLGDEYCRCRDSHRRDFYRGRRDQVVPAGGPARPLRHADCRLRLDGCRRTASFRCI